MSGNVVPLFGPDGCCGARHFLGFSCTEPPAHSSWHVAEGPYDEVLVRWR